MDEEVWRIVPSQPELRASSWGRIFRQPFQRRVRGGGFRWYRMQPTFGYKAASIPAGTEIVDINYATEKFEPGKTDDDYRFGMLAFGVLCPVC